MIKKFETDCDMGSIKIFNESMSCFFGNGIGDVPTVVYINDKVGGSTNGIPYDFTKAKFLEHFTVKTEAYLADYDCSEEGKLFTFTKGRWFVSLLEDAVMYIEKVDEDIHA
jgi:hypothetical protein